MSSKWVQPRFRLSIEQSKPASKRKVFEINNVIALQLPPRYNIADFSPLPIDEIQEDRNVSKIIDHLSLQKYAREQDGSICDREYEPMKHEQKILKTYDLLRNPVHKCVALGIMRRQQRMFDLLIRVKGTDYGCHRTLLYGESPFIKKKLSYLDDSLVLLIELEKSTHNGVIGCLDFLYRRRIQMNMQNVAHFIAASKELGIIRLLEKCIKFLNSCQLTNPIECFLLAKRLDILNFENEIKMKINERGLDIFSSNILLKYSVDDLLDLIDDVNICSSEKSISEFLKKYSRLYGEADVCKLKKILITSSKAQFGSFKYISTNVMKRKYKQ
ncbi:hypothetical protein ACOME3_004732 [Neoechinorhynchus agilis]